jgi:hypothetical protein
LHVWSWHPEHDGVDDSRDRGDRRVWAGPDTVVEAVNPAVGSASKTTTNAVVSLAFSIRPG